MQAPSEQGGGDVDRLSHPRDPQVEVHVRRVLELKPDDGPSKFYLVKLDDLRTQSLPEDWATHTILREK